MFKSVKDFLLPHEGNDHHPHFWRTSGTVIFLSIIIAIESFFFISSFLVLNKGSFLASVFSGTLVAFTNDVRAGSNLPLLKENPLLVKAAQLKADDMAKRGYFSHYTPEGNAPWIFIDEVGYDYRHAGENLAINFIDSKDVVDAWVKSPTHYANLIKNSYKEIGIATAEGVYQGRSTIFVVEFFGDPVKASEPAAILAKATTTPKLPRSAVGTSLSVKVTNEATTTSASSTAQNASVVRATGSSPKVFGLETDVPAKLTQDGGYFNAIITSPRHIVSILLSILGLFVVAFLLFSIKRHNQVHHVRIIQIALCFVFIIILSLILNSVFLEGVVGGLV